MVCGIRKEMGSRQRGWLRPDYPVTIVILFRKASCFNLVEAEPKFLGIFLSYE